VCERQRRTFSSTGADCGESSNQRGASDDSRIADKRHKRFSRIGRSRNSRIDSWTNFRVDVWTINVRPNNSGANQPWHYAAWNHHSSSGHDSANSRDGSSNAGYGDSGNNAWYNQYPDSADNAEYSRNHHSGHDDAGFKSKFASSGINQSSEQHASDYHTADNA
jgi:hypothetical protein